VGEGGQPTAPFFCDFRHPSGNYDTNPHINDDTWGAAKLSLRGINSGPQLEEPGCLPCGADELLIRNGYREMYDILLEAEEDRLTCIREDRRIPHTDKIILLRIAGLGYMGFGRPYARRNPPTGGRAQMACRGDVLFPGS